MRVNVLLQSSRGILVHGEIIQIHTILYSSGRQPPGRGPVPVREEFVAGPYHFPGLNALKHFCNVRSKYFRAFYEKERIIVQLLSHLGIVTMA